MLRMPHQVGYSTSHKKDKNDSDAAFAICLSLNTSRELRIREMRFRKQELSSKTTPGRVFAAPIRKVPNTVQECRAQHSPRMSVRNM